MEALCVGRSDGAVTEFNLENFELWELRRKSGVTDKPFQFVSQLKWPCKESYDSVAKCVITFIG